MIISETKGFVFFHIPKTAGVSVRSVLEKYKTFGPKDYGFKLNHLRIDTLHINQDIAQTFYDINHLTEFVIVREPIERLISLYNYTRNSYRFTFEEFLKVVAKHQEKPSVLKNLFNSQLDWIRDKTKILKFEDVVINTKHEFSKVDLDIEKIERINPANVSYTPSQNEIKICLSILKNEFNKLNYDLTKWSKINELP